MVEQKQIIKLGIILLIIGVMLPVGISLWSEGNIQTPDLNESVKCEHSIDEINVTSGVPNATIQKPVNSNLDSISFEYEINGMEPNAINETIDIETSYTSTIMLDGETRATSFILDQSSTTTNVSVYLDAPYEGGDIWLAIVNSTWDDVNSRSKPNNIPKNWLYSNYDKKLFVSSNGWNVFTFYKYLNNSLTQNNTWFVIVNDYSGDGYWHYVSDGDDNSKAYILDPDNVWSYETRDYSTKVGIGYIEDFEVPTEYTYNINEFSSTIQIESTIDWTNVSRIEISNIYILTDMEYTYNTTTLILSVNVNITLDDFEFTMNVSYNPLFTIDLIELDGGGVGYSELGNVIMFSLTDGLYEIYFSFSNAVYNIYDMFPIFVVIAIVMIIVYEYIIKRDE